MRLIIASLVIACIAVIAPKPIAAMADNGGYYGRTEYMPCAYEDSYNCVWDAEHLGNGRGKSFFMGKNGKVHYLPHHIAHYLLYHE